MSGIINKTPDMRSGVVGVWDHNDFYKLKAYSPSFGNWSAAIASVQLNKHYPYEVSDGTWRVRFNIILTVPSGTNLIFQDLGHVFADVGGTRQEIVGHGDQNGTTNFCHVESNGNKIYCAATVASTIFGVSGDVLLESKPTYV